MTNPGPWKPNQTTASPASEGDPQPKKRLGCMKWGFIVIGALVALFFIVGLSGGFDSDETASEGASETTAQEAPEQQDAPEPEDAPAANPEDALTEAIQSEVDDANVYFEEGYVDVSWPMKPGWSESTMATSTQRDTVDIIAAVKDSPFADSALGIAISAELVDQMGNENTRDVVTMRYEPETLAQINPEGIRAENVWEVSDGGFVHPIFR